ncbi:MAG TPA: tetratricopeptide repeat protein [Candidatus Eisenbacteria bacterium]
MEKAIEIKRRAQRCIQSGDLDGALAEYEKLVAAPDSDPYNLVLLADLLFKRGDTQNAVERYLAAATAYERVALYKNAIAVCKKMSRLSLSPGLVLERLAHLHALDGLSTEATMYLLQYAEHLMRENRAREAMVALRQAFEASPDEVGTLERLAQVQHVAENPATGAHTLAEAAFHYRRLGQNDLARHCEERAERMRPGSVADFEAERTPASLNGTPTLAPSAEDATPGLIGFLPAAPPDRLDLERAHDRQPFPDPSEGIDDDLESIEDEPDAIERFPAARARGGETGLDFSSPSLAERPPSLTSERKATTLLSAAEIERLLAEAQERFRAGEREAAGELLVEAAQAYEAVGRLDNAASIYRGLYRGPHAPPALMDLWLANCEQRGDRREAAQVACELGDRALQVGDLEGARSWFERAQAYDQNNAIAERRLSRLGELASGATVATAETATETEPPAHERLSMPALEPAWNPPAPHESGPPVLRPDTDVEAPAAPHPPEATAGRVEMALGRSEAVSFDLGALLSEFQRGIEAQLSGDAQSHYDLAMAYREMGLLEPAMESFRIAASDPVFAQRSAEMMGRCLLDQGRFDESIQHFAAALALEGTDPGSNLELRYQLGLALEAGAQLREALTEFERVFAAQPGFRDVATKLRALRKAVENA